jgi:hypothetical protein
MVRTTKERTMFQPVDVIGAAVGRGLLLLAAHKRGDTVAWGAIEAAAGFARDTQHWPQFFKRLRLDYLSKTGVCLWPVNGVGMKLLTVAEQLNERAAARRRRAVKQMTRDRQELEAIPARDLTDYQKFQRSAQIDQSRTARRAVLASVRKGNALAGGTKTGLPRVKPTAATT